MTHPPFFAKVFEILHAGKINFNVLFYNNLTLVQAYYITRKMLWVLERRRHHCQFSPNNNK